MWSSPTNWCCQPAAGWSCASPGACMTPSRVTNSWTITGRIRPLPRGLRGVRPRLDDYAPIAATPSRRFLSPSTRLEKWRRAGLSAARTQVRALSHHRLERVGVVRGHEGPHSLARVENESDRLLGPLRIEVGPQFEICRSPDTPLTRQGSHGHAFETPYGAVGHTLGAPGKVVAPDVYALGVTRDDSVVVVPGHRRILSLSSNYGKVFLVATTYDAGAFTLNFSPHFEKTSSLMIL